MKNTINLFAQIAKVDMAKHEVWGIATAEMVDKEGEIFDYDSSKPYFKTWSDEFAKATDGKSLGNVREMHEPSAVGKLIALDFDDDLKQIRVGAKIIDDKAWEKCMEGVYTGFSIGGAYVKAWKDGEYVRFTAKPVEISVVDNPCVPGAHFTAVKADGTYEIKKVKGATIQKKTPVTKSMLDVGDLAYLIANVSYLQGIIESEAIWEGDESPIPEKLSTWINEGCEILRELLAEEAAELTDNDKTVRAAIQKYLAKAGAKHSAATQAHHAAIAKCMGAIAKACGTAQDHCDALMGKAVYADITKQVPAEPEPKIETQESNMLEVTEKQQLEKAHADSADALSKVATVEKGITDLKAEMTANNEEIKKSLTGLLSLIEKLISPEPNTQKVNRAAVPTVTVTKEQDTGDKPEVEKAESVHDLLKASLRKPQPASVYLR